MKQISVLKNKAEKISKILLKTFPNAHCELTHSNAFQLLIATILSAQCTDVRVNMVTPNLFAAFPDCLSLSQANQHQVEILIKSTGFYKNKAKNIIACSQKIIEKFAGEIPQNISDLTSLPGVGRKTANVVLGNAFGIKEGIVVDTHVKRITNLLKLTSQSDPEKIETDLMLIFPKKIWTHISHLFIFLGRKICIARKPQCLICPLSDICPSAK